MRSEYPTIAQIKGSYPPGKWEPFWTTLVLRPLSFPAAWLFVRTGMSANQISLYSVFILIIAGFLMVTGVKSYITIGTVLFNCWALMDCVDGHVARVKGEASVYGGWMDALGGYVAYCCVLFTGGIAAGCSSGGAVAAICNLLMRLLYQHFRCLAGQMDAAETIKPQKRIGANLGVTGFLMPAILVGALLDWLRWIILFYAAFYTISCIIISFRLIKRVEVMQNNYLLQKSRVDK